MNKFTYSFAAVYFFFQMRDLEEMVHQVTFDGILTKPVHPFFHIVILTIYNRFVRILLTSFIPYAFVNFYPSQFFLHKSGEALFSPLLQYATPIVGVLLFLISFKIWIVGGE
jgi:ABC-type uncharacterized transport system permease subunit